MIKFFLNDVEINVLTYPQIIETKDETLDTCSIVLAANDNDKPYAPYQTLKVMNDDEVVNIFKVASDSVSLFSTNPMRYTHTLNLIQNIKYLEQHLLRNSVFAQPANNIRKFYFSRMESLYFDPETRDYKYIGYPADGDSVTFGQKSQYWVDDLVLNRKEKIKNAKMRCRYYEVNSNNQINFKQGNVTISGIHTIFNGAIRLKRPDEETFQLVISDKPNNTWIDIPSSGGKTFIEFVNYSSNQKTITLDGVPRIDRESATENDAYAKIFQLEIEVEVYYFTAYDILNDILKQYRKNYQGKVDTSFLFELPSSGELYDLLTTTIPPTMTFTQSTVFDAVAEIFKLFDAIFTLDENNVLGIEYFNERNENQVSKNVMSGFGSTISSNSYNNGLVTYFQNAIQKQSFPKNSFAGLRSTNAGIAEQNSFSLIVPHPINYIDKLVGFYKSEEGQGTCGYIPNFEPSVGKIPIYGKIELDLTPFIFEESIYALLDESLDTGGDSGYYNRSKQTAVYYNRNSNIIPLFSPTYTTWWGQTINNIESVYKVAWHRFFGFRNDYYDYGNNNIAGPAYGNDPANYLLKINYLSIIDGRAKVESLENKYAGELITNQGQGQIDLNKLGLNLVGLSLKLGQPTLSFTHEISDFSNRIKKGQIYIDENNDVWVANVCTYTILNNNKIQGNIEFTKNFNALSLNVRVDQEKRLTNISNDLAIKCEDDFVEYVYFSQNAEDIESDQHINFNKSYLARAVKETFKPTGELHPISVAYFGARYDDSIRIRFRGNEFPAQQIYIPLSMYGFGNAICFEIAFDSPISAGKQTSKSPTWYADKYYTIEYLYTDDNGWADKVDITFSTAETVFDQDFPYIENAILNAENLEICCNISELEFLKKPNEIFALNYELVFLPIPNRENIDFIGSSFINNNALFNRLATRKCYLYYSYNEDVKYSVLDLKGQGDFVEITNISLTNNNEIVFASSLLSKPECWALCDEEGNILFASNECINFNNGEITLYLITRQKRL